MAPLFDLAWVLRACYLVTIAARLPARFKHTGPEADGMMEQDCGHWSLWPLTLTSVHISDLAQRDYAWLCMWEFLPQVSIMCIIFCTSTCADWILNNSVDGHKVWSQFYVFQRMNPHHFVVFKIFHNLPPLGQLSNMLWTLAQHFHDGFAPLVDFGSPSLHLCRLLYTVDMWKIFCQILKGFL